MTKTILFRADGNAKTGLGHLYRLFSLVEMTKGQYNFVFLTKEESTTKVIPKEYRFVTIPQNITIDQEPEWVNSQFRAKSHSMIVDGYHFNSSYQKKLKAAGYTFIYIDDLATEHMYADIVINHSPDLNETHYKTEPYTQLALGTQFALLRPAFLKAAREKRKTNSIETAFVCFGGSDPNDLSFKAVKALLQFKKINIVLGEAYNHKDIIELAKQYSDKIKLYKNLSETELVNVMKESHIGIAPASTILYELCCVKMPILSGFYVENQKNIYRELADLNVIYSGGDFRKATTEDFQSMITSLLKSPLHNAYLENQSKIFDGNSSQRILGLINRLHISFRKASEKDMLTVFKWSNDNLVRQNSYNSDEIALKDHKNWFTNKIKDEKSLFLIVLVNNQPSGIVRYEINNEYSVVGIVVSKDYRGQGLATYFLKEAAAYYFKRFDKPIHAYIKKENLASIKSFEKARFKHFKDEIIKGNLSFVYKLKKSDAER